MPVDILPAAVSGEVLAGPVPTRFGEVRGGDQDQCSTGGRAASGTRRGDEQKSVVTPFPSSTVCREGLAALDDGCQRRREQRGAGMIWFVG